jgi:hypothetical protein
MSKIDQRTTIPVFVIGAIVPSFVGFVLWLSSISYTAKGAEAKVAEIEQKQKTTTELLMSMKEDLRLIKYKLEIKEEQDGK